MERQNLITSMFRYGSDRIFRTSFKERENLLRTVLRLDGKVSDGLYKKIYRLFEINENIPYYYLENDYPNPTINEIVYSHVERIIHYIFKDYKNWIEEIESCGDKHIKDKYVEEVIERWKHPKVKKMLTGNLGQQLAELKYSLIEMPKEYSSSLKLEVWKNESYEFKKYLPFVEFDPKQNEEVPVWESFLCFVNFPEHIETFAEIHDTYLEAFSEYGIRIEPYRKTQKFRDSREYGRIFGIKEIIGSANKK